MQIHTTRRKSAIHGNYSASICSRSEKGMLFRIIHAARFQFSPHMLSRSPVCQTYPSYNNCPSRQVQPQHYVDYLFIRSMNMPSCFKLLLFVIHFFTPHRPLYLHYSVIFYFKQDTVVLHNEAYNAVDLTACFVFATEMKIHDGNMTFLSSFFLDNCCRLNINFTFASTRFT